MRDRDDGIIGEALPLIQELDPIRAEALAQASSFELGRGGAPPERVLETARSFEAFLRGPTTFQAAPVFAERRDGAGRRIAPPRMSRETFGRREGER